MTDLSVKPALSPTTKRALSEALAGRESAEDASRAMSPSPGPHERPNITPSDKQEVKDETKRARRSAIEKKSRMRRLNGLQRMRDEVQRLEEVREAFYERFNLQRMIRSHETFQQTVKGLCDAQDVWNSGVPPSSSLAVEFRQRSVAECYDIVRESYAEIQRFSESDNYETTGANFMGWTDKRRFDEKTKALQYGFTKTFPLKNPEELLRKSWNMFADGPNLENMSFNGSVHTRYEVLQALNDDLLIFRRDFSVPGIPTTLVTVSIIFRLQTPSGYMFCTRTIPAPEIESALEPHECYHDIFHWTQFNRIFNKYGSTAGCEVISAGSIGDHAQLESTYWLFELVCAAVRWETACVAPLFLKRA